MLHPGLATGRMLWQSRFGLHGMLDVEFMFILISSAAELPGRPNISMRCQGLFTKDYS